MVKSVRRSKVVLKTRNKKPISRNIQISHKKKAVLVGFIAAFAYLGILFVQTAVS